MFLFAPCQVGAEKAFKSEVRRRWPVFRVAFSRPGFLTFKVPDDADPTTIAEFADRSVFARTASLSLDKVQADDVDKAATKIWAVCEKYTGPVHRLHVFRRDPDTPGHNGFEPGLVPELRELHRLLHAACPRPRFFGPGAADADHPALLGETVLDVVQVDPGLYYVGIHTIPEGASLQACYPGGVMPITLPADAVSRAWLKFEEGLCWSGFPIEPGTRCVDLGAAPGGGSQVLLARGADVLGVDPAEMAPIVLEHPGFTHLRGRVNQTKRSLYRKARWLIADMNVAPGYTLDVLEELVGRKDIRPRGMLFTLKLFQWELAENLPLWIARIRRWGFDDVRVKQLAFNRREVMVAAS